MKSVTPENAYEEDSWSVLHLPLLVGFYQVVIMGIRPDSEEYSGVAIDDIHLAPCDEFRKKTRGVFYDYWAFEKSFYEVVNDGVSIMTNL